MISACKVIGRGLRSVQNAGYAYIWANLACVVLSLPLVTAPAAFSALFRVSYLAQNQPGEADLAAFWDAFRANLVRTLPWGLLNVLFAIINFSNLVAYQAATTPQGMLLRSVWLLAGFIWLGMLLYTWPIYYAMDRPSIFGAARNAALMVLANPLFTLILVLAIGLLALVSTLLVAAWLLLTWGAIAALATAAVQDRLAAYRSVTSPI
jgi:uncharacterized membrane protein YesL